MKVFADTLHWVAITNPHDTWHLSAKAAIRTIEHPQIVTTEEVLSEYLTAMASCGSHLRRTAIEILRSILDNDEVVVLPQSHQSFESAVELYADRSDKSYSLIDCRSMMVMRKLGISHVLTNDHHFTQEGFQILIHKPTD